jgi:hypothetical protein
MSTVDVLILVDCSSRELVGSLLVRHYLAELGLTSKICSKLLWNHYFNKYQPKAVLFPNGGSPSCKVVYDKCFTFVMPSESGNGQKKQIINIHAGTSLCPCDTAYTDLFFSWGEQMTEWLVESNAFKRGQIVTCGHPSTDHWMLPSTSQGKKLIGLTTTLRFCGQQDFIKWIYHAEYRGGDGTFYSPPEHAESWIYWEASFIRTLINIINDVVIPNRLRCELRPHPFEIESTYKYLTERSDGLVQIKKEGTISEWLENISALFTFMSASAIDAVVKGVPVVSLKNILNRDALNRLPKGYIYDYYQYFWQIDSLEQFNEYSQAAFAGQLEPAKDMDRLKEFIFKHYNYPRCKPSSKLIAESIADFICNRKPKVFKPLYNITDSSFKKMAKKIVTLYPELVIDYILIKRLVTSAGDDPRFSYISWKIQENIKAIKFVKRFIEAC